MLESLHRSERLSEIFMRNLLPWVHPGFSLFAGPALDGVAVTSFEPQSRYIMLSRSAGVLGAPWRPSGAGSAVG